MNAATNPSLRTLTALAAALLTGLPMAAAAGPTAAAVAAAAPVAAAAAISAGPAAARQPLTPARAATLAQHVNQHVIVLMKRQFAAAPAGSPAGSPAAGIRSAAVASAQAPLVRELQAVHATGVRTYRLVNALAATVSADEIARLRANPTVARVIPDQTIRGAQPGLARGASAGTATAGGRGPVAASPHLHVIPGACGPHGQVQLAPEGLALTHTDSDDPHAPTARALGITGAGVKVGFIADGMDPHNVNFLRDPRDPASTVFSDYQDFSGDGPGQPVATGGNEGFMDANTIAGQGRHVYNVRDFSLQPDPSACNIRIEGVAPGASLVGLNAYGTFEDTTISNFLEAIDYAVETDHVNVLNESFAGNEFPDTAVDVIKQFDDAAVAAGVVISAASGDGGPTNTIGSPASDPAIIAVGGSTQFQFYAQTNYAAARYFATSGWLDDNISTFSSGGFDEGGGTVNLVAPADGSFTSCTPNTRLYYCYNFRDQPSSFEGAGGTSEAAPFVSGAAALVIQAYRKTHHGATPSPALVKQILVSSASDIGAAADEQGAGLLDSYQAVRLAESVHTSDGAPRPSGSTLLTSAGQLSAAGLPGTRESWPVTVTNTGSWPQLVSIGGRTLGPDENVRAGRVRLSDATSPHFINYGGARDNYAVIHFTVPPGRDRLGASLAWPGNPADPSSVVRLVLVDPRGRFAANSDPQGPGNHGSVEVTRPAPGRWTGVVISNVAAVGGFNGTVQWRVATQRYVAFGSAWPPTVFLAPGQARTVTVSATTPPAPGDAAGSVVIRSDLGFGGVSTIPVTLRSLVDVAHGGAFRGVLTGGNDRPSGEGQEEFYQFGVTAGVRDITASVSLANDRADPVGAYLVSPDGDPLGYGQNDTGGGQTLSLDAYTLHPVPGTWTLVVEFAEPEVGNELAQPYTGHIAFDQVRISAAGLPDSTSTKLAAGTPVTVPVRITNTGAAPEAFFTDPRLNQTARLTLAGLDQTSGLPLPLTGNPPLWFVPTQTSSVSVISTATLPIMFDFGPYAGDPDLASSRFGPGPLCADTETGTYRPPGRAAADGIWSALPDECGPYPGPAPKGTVSSAMTVQTKPFDPAVSSATGDLMLTAINPAATVSPVIIKPGHAATITVTITPSGPPGTQVSGTLYVDDQVSNVPPYGQYAGDELAGLRYAYTVK